MELWETFSYPFSRGCGELALCGGSGKQPFQTKGLGEGVCAGLRNTAVQPSYFTDVAVANVLLLSLARFD